MSTYREIEEDEYDAIDKESDDVVVIDCDDDDPISVTEKFIGFLEGRGFSVEWTDYIDGAKTVIKIIEKEGK